MSRQYLKELQERAQKLLEVSSDEDQQINAYTAPHVPSKSPPRIDLQDFLEQNHSEPELSDNDLSPSTDIELLKKCIALTNENSNLRILVEKQEKQIRSLESQLSQQIEEESSINSKINSKSQEVARNDRQLKILASQMANLQRELSDMKVEKSLLKKQYEEFQREKQEFRRDKENFSRSVEVRRGQKPEIDIQQDYTVKTIKNNVKQIENNRKSEYQARIRRLQTLLRDEKAKVTQLCHFVNGEIPDLKDRVVDMTAKLDHKVSKYLLRDFQH